MEIKTTKVTHKGNKITKAEIAWTNPRKPSVVTNTDLTTATIKTLGKAINGLYHQMVKSNATQGKMTFEKLHKFYGNTLIITLKTKDHK